MTAIDTGMLRYNNQPLKIPGGAKQVQGTGATIAPGGAIDRKSKLYEQCQEFEAIFVKMMLKEMKATVPKNSLMGGGQAEEIFDDMLTDERSKAMTKASNFGFADTLYRQLSTLG